MNSSGHQSGKMSHVDQKESADLIRDLSHAREIDDSRIGAAPTNDELWALFFGEFLQIVVVDSFSFPRHAIGNDAVGLARKIQMMSVSEMAAMRQVEPKYGVARLQNRRISFHVGLRTRMGLHIGVLRPKQLFCALARQGFHYIGELAAAVVTFSRISFGI